MTREEILAMQPGPELDRLVMEKVFNARKNYYGEEEYWYHYDEHGEPDYEWSCYNSPSTDISAAWEVVEKLCERADVKFSIDHGYSFEHKFNAGFNYNNGSYAGHTATTAPEAICKAALLAVMEGKVEES